MLELPALLWWLRAVVFGCFAYLLVNYAAFFVLAAVSLLESMRRRAESRAEDQEAVALSRFTIPVSVIAPAFDEEPVIESTIRTLLELDYPEYEVLVVNDGSRDGTLARLRDGFGLEPRQVFYRDRIPTAEATVVYVSARHPRLRVIDKKNGGKADALNCGINFARYRYVCCIDADSFYDPKALLHAMRLVQKDPAAVVGVTSPVAISAEPETWHRAAMGEKPMDALLLTSFQHLDYSRAFLNNRIGWSRWKFMLCTVGAFAIWRRDLLVELGGFSRQFTCEDIEMTFRAHARFLERKEPYRILCMPEVVAVTEGPDRTRNLIAQRARWQRVINETVWHYRRMLLNPRFGAVGLLGMPYYFLFEALTPLVEFVAFVTLPLAWWLGFLSWPEFFWLVGSISFANAVLTNWSLISESRIMRRYPLSTLARYTLLGVGEYLLYRPIIFVARWKGVIGFLRGDKSWHKFVRNMRRSNAPAS